MIDPIFADVKGREQLLEVLSRILSHPGNAYLFAGPSGVGKRLVAECFAAGILHISRLSLFAHPDFIRLLREEGARDITVKQARELIQRVSLSSARGGRMVVLIEEADTLNEEAANALLKVVEEPRPRVTYIFLAERSERIPATLRSRMAVLRFERTVATPLSPPFTRGEVVGLGEVVGKKLSTIESLSKFCESQESPEQAWRQQLIQAMELCRASFPQDPKRSLRLAEGLIHAWKLVGSSLSPRFALEWSGVRDFIPSPSLPSFLDLPYL